MTGQQESAEYQKAGDHTSDEGGAIVAWIGGQMQWPNSKSHDECPR